MKIQPNHEKLLYSGRIDWTNPVEPVWVFPCTSVKLRFTGNEMKVLVKNNHAYWDNFLGCILDGEQSKLPVNESGITVLEIPVTSTENKEHELLLFKRQDSCHELTVLGFEIADGETLLEPGKKPGRRIEVYGDSVSAGEVSEAVAYTGKEDPQHNGEYSNSWYSYSWMTARKLDAEIHDIAQGGIALMNNTGWFYEPNAIGMEYAWNKIHYNPQFGEATEWDFAQYTPQVVIVAIGQNDSHPDDYMKEDYNGERALLWRNHYKAFLETLRRQYPDAHIVCCTTLLGHDEAWDRSIGEAVTEMADKKITQCRFKRNGKGTPGHLRIAEAEEMAEELSAYIENLPIEGWE
ncbi:MAG: GDSL-type esterase/lipase family protein [Lachnospiraceae bacterium]|nr:GDSL-type esterase/lipase family protein [Lachnospiraceae bacterium]